MKKIGAFIGLGVLLLGLLIYSAGTGGIKITYHQLFQGLFVAYDEHVAIIYDMRFPRILVSLFGGGALAVSGVLFQGVMKNPLADPGIIGISSGSSFAAVLGLVLFPSLHAFTPLFAFLGGVLSCLLVYSLSWKSGLSPLRVILVGIAVNAVFIGMMQGFGAFMGNAQTGAAAIVNANIAQKTWKDVHLLVTGVSTGMLMSMALSSRCNLLALEDKTVRSVGVNIHLLRLMVSAVAVLLASMATAIVGIIAFLGLIVPHIGRLIIGNDQRFLIPFSMLLGGAMMLLADTIGRVIAEPYEIPVAVFMSVIGGPLFIVLLRRSEKIYGS